MEAANRGHTATVQSLVAFGAYMSIQTKVSDIIVICAASHN